MQIQLIRHSTIVLSWDDISLLVDPMLNPKDATDPIANTPNQVRNPTIDMPLTDAEVIALVEGVDGIVVTHLHNDHWDARAQELTPKNKPIFCQPPDAERIRSQGFTNVTPVENTLTWRGIEMIRTGGEHGTGEIGEMMNPVSGFIFRAEGARSVYVAGDTIWCEEVAQVLERDRPGAVVLNAGAAQFLVGDPISMGPQDVIAVCQAAPEADVIAVHMDSINHCLLTRRSLATALEEAGLQDRVLIPADGEVLTLAD
jgi:L-ascorbate metabolism protein UlaG (beta-lactamase superfamily)